MKLQIKKPFVGFYLLACSLLFTIIGFALYFATFRTFDYQDDRWVIALTIISLYSILFLMINGLLAGDQPFWTGIFHLVITFALVISFANFLIPCLSPIGIYFTVNMGDMETYAIGVPRCLAGVAFYVLAILCNVVSSFFSPVFQRKKQKGASYEAK